MPDAVFKVDTLKAGESSAAERFGNTLISMSRLFALIPVTACLAGCVLSAGSGGNSSDASEPPSDAAVADTQTTDAAAAGCRDLDAEVLVYLTLEGPAVDGLWPDQRGVHNANALPTAAAVTAGPPGCGNAFDASGGRYLRIEDNPAFDLSVGSLEIYARVPMPGAEHAIVSRDFNGDIEGHFDVVFNPAGQVVVRSQGLGADVEAFRCSLPQTPGQWVEISLNFGPPDLEMFVDGVRAEELAAIYLNGQRVCGGPSSVGLGAASLPWIIGASLRTSPTLDGPVSVQLGTAIDEFRLSGARRSY